MEFADIIRERKSIRAFRADRVARADVERVIASALRAPSALNLQPWEMTVVMDDERKRLSRVLLKAFHERRISCSPGNVKPLPPAIIARGKESFEGMKPCLDRMGFDFDGYINEGSCNFYGAPVAIILCIDNAFSKARLVDVGVCLGYLLLAAHDAGLATCPVGLISAYEEEVKDCLNIPDNKNVVIGVALGLADRDSPVNGFTSTRQSLSEFVRWVD